jgi:RNA-directed DNA polymerase
MQHARDRVREITARERLLLPLEEIVQDLNGYLRGWAGDFRYENSARHFNLIEHHGHGATALSLCGRSMACGRDQVHAPTWACRR